MRNRFAMSRIEMGYYGAVFKIKKKIKKKSPGSTSDLGTKP
jgi:hypothetical protein